MADATPPPAADTGLLPRTYFKAPRVPLDLRALFLALVGFGVFRAGNEILWQIFKQKNVVVAFFDKLMTALNVPYIRDEIHRFIGDVFVGGEAGRGGEETNVWHVIIGGLWTFTVFGFFGQAIHRITALRIARDEGLSLKDAVGFARKNFSTVMLCPLIVAGFVAFLVGCNALAGAVIAIPFAGEILSVVLVPLAMISSLLVLLILIGAVVGMPLVASAAAWERNGSLDALSRAFSYVFARPLQFFWNALLVFLFTSVILIVGGKFESIVTGSIDLGVWRDAPSVIVNTDGKRFDKLDADAQKLYGELSKPDNAGMTRPFARSFSAVTNTETGWGDKLTALVFWALLNLVHFGVLATALWWFLGAMTATYADLRCDVDGTEEDEIYLEEDEADFDALATPPPSSPPPPPPPPAGTPPPTPAVPPPPTA